MREWLGRVGVKTLFIELGSPEREWHHGEVFLYGFERDELLEREGFDTLHGPRCSSCGGGSTPTRSDRTVPWDTGPSRRGSPVRSHGVRLSKRTGLFYTGLFYTGLFYTGLFYTGLFYTGLFYWRVKP